MANDGHAHLPGVGMHGMGRNGSLRKLLMVQAFWTIAQAPPGSEEPSGAKQI